MPFFAEGPKARVGIERGSFTTPNLTHSVSRLEELFSTTRSLRDLSCHLPAYNAVIEEIVEGFLDRLEPFADGPSGKVTPDCIAPAHCGTERIRQKLLVAAFGVLVNTSTPPTPVELVASGIQSAGDGLNVESNA